MTLGIPPPEQFMARLIPMFLFNFLWFKSVQNTVIRVWPPSCEMMPLAGDARRD